MSAEMDSLVQRVKRLERQNRQLKFIGLGFALCLLILLLAGATIRPRTIEAEKFVLLDNHGRTRLTIGTPALAGATVDTNPDDPVVWLSDGKGADRAMLTVDGLFFASSKARPTVSLSSNPDGTSGLKFYGINGKVSWSVP